ncbi:hypothetical protein [Paenibacillus sp. WLX2291]|uniref:hypothetical protein n=1 Tax=Paenibacillus sp. WLX2291 TaxID=3296934 RepID=UPI003984567F
MEMNRDRLLEYSSRMRSADRSWYYRGKPHETYWHELRHSTVVAKDIQQIVDTGEQMWEQHIPELTYTLFAIFAEKGSRLEYENVYFERRCRLNTYALLTLLEPEQSGYMERLNDMLWAICDEYTWCLPAHVAADHHPAEIAQQIDLFAAETCFALAEIMLLLGERLPRLLRERITYEVERRIFQPFLSERSYHWQNARHNWAAVCAGSIGAAALLLLDDTERLADILVKTQHSMECYLDGFGEDGACLEGVGYWNYGFGFFVYYADLLRKRSDGELDWFQNKKVASIATFQQTCFLDGSLVANFSDSLPHVHVHMGLSHYLAEQYAAVQLPPQHLRATYSEDHCSRWAPALRNLLWTMEAPVVQDWQDGSYYLQDASWLISRHHGGDHRYGFAAKGGHNDEPHNHNDLGQFIWCVDGEVYLADLGSGEYTAAYFGEGRYAYDCNGSQGHSVPMIHGQLQCAGSAYRAEVLHAQIGAERDEWTVELNGAYDIPQLQSLTRSLIWHKGAQPYVKLTDSYVYDGTPSSWRERFVTWKQPELAVNEGTVILPGEHGQVEVEYDPQRCQVVITPQRYRDHFGVDTVWYSVDFDVIKPGAEEALTFIFRFVPLCTSSV